MLFFCTSLSTCILELVPCLLYDEYVFDSEKYQIKEENYYEKKGLAIVMAENMVELNETNFPEEREKFSKLLDRGFIDTFRYFYPDKADIYSWWSYRFKAREKNAGWRIDYFLVSKRLEDKLKDAVIHTEIFGSDHCPVELDIDL